ncbi:hypothetical protein [Pararcticibacter amylolyticus]|uniref:DUF2383 domain-containing protein n=1 Tax=Pararcticibacter amylolyticus TaxID=2173175 RepID=A0A2U2PGL9_9SPHI|nr:hypothetical protein [Pararcticibacter amylolyticus]PWG80474.1 hypothetical protein DDR33_12820 [Pararcticibacter amylolyticus]
MKPETLDKLSSLIEINSQRVLAYERALRELKREDDPDDCILFDSLAKESHLYKQALNIPL